MIELIGVILLAVSPWLLKTVTNGVKYATTIRLDPERKTLIRVALGILSFAVAVGHALLSGEPVPSDTIAAFVDVLEVGITSSLVWLATTGLYFFEKKTKTE